MTKPPPREVVLGGTKRVFPVSSFLTPRTGRDFRVVMRRDLGAALDVASALSALGYGYGEQILDHPPPYVVEEPSKEKDFPVDLSFVRRGDVLLQTTRPPMDDKHAGDRKQVVRSYTDLEAKLFRVWRKYLAHCSRSQVRLHEDLWRFLKPHDKDHRAMGFREAEGAPYKFLNTCERRGRRGTNEETERRTAAFLLRVNQAWKGGPGLVGAFGIDSTATTVWCYRLAHDLSYLLAEPGFVVAELENTGILERPTNMRWAHKWDVRLLLKERF